jgi:hypothetical protein
MQRRRMQTHTIAYETEKTTMVATAMSEAALYRVLHCRN